MAPRIKPTPKTKNGKFLNWISLVLAVLGTCDAIYLLILKLTQAEAMCVGNHGCLTVNNSPYSEIHGLPISVIGLFAYLVIIAVLLLEPHWKPARQNGPLAIFGISLIGVLYSAYLTYLELYVIHALCPFCVVSAILIMLLLILAIIRLVVQNEH